MTTRTRHAEGDRRRARPRAPQLPDPARRRCAGARGGDGAGRHGGLQPARRRRAGRRPDLVRGLFRRPGASPTSATCSRSATSPASTAGRCSPSGSRCAPWSPGSASSPPRTPRAASRSTTGRSGARGCAGRDAVARVLALGALEYAVLAPAAMICAVVLLFGTGGHVQHAMTYPWLAVVPGFLVRALGQLAEACRAALRSRATAGACASGSRISSPGSSSSAAC